MLEEAWKLEEARVYVLSKRPDIENNKKFVSDINKTLTEL
jgi:hypothetical protein